LNEIAPPRQLDRSVAKLMRVPQPSIVVLLLASIATASCGCRLAKDDVLQMGRKVETELPLGSTPAQVTKFLDDQHIENGPGGIQIFDTHRYDRLEKVSGYIYSYGRGEPAGDLHFFFRDGKLVEWWVSSDCGGGCYSIRGNKPMYRQGVTNECYDP
jgi:hypothetical protein